MPLFGIDKVVKYHMDVPLYVTTFAWVMNKAKYEGMSASQKKAVDDHCNNDWALKIAANWADFEASGRDKIKAMSGHEVYSISADQLALWRKAASPLEEKWAGDVKKAGGDPAAMMNELKAALVKFGAAY